MYCKHCGEDNPDEAVFCKNCGTKLKEDVKKAEVIEPKINNNQQTTSNSSDGGSNWMSCCLCIIVIFIVFSIIGIIFH